MVSPLPYTLSTRPKVAWTASREHSLATDCPFDLANNSDAHFVTRTYLQFLWLPQSLMPLDLFVPSLQRVTTDPSTSIHPLHALLKPLLQTPRSASAKYRVELLQILASGGGAGEIEESVMWYALSHEPADDALCARITEGPWEDEGWRESWIERMERREVQIQILLYFLILSLPGPPPPQDAASPKKRRQKDRKVPSAPPASIEDTLEGFMDKLSMWQLMTHVEDGRKTVPHTKKDDLDWMQQFFSDAVHPQFANTVPEMCQLLHSKVFPTSPFSASSAMTSPTSSRAPSPESAEHQQTKATQQRGQSPAPSTTSSRSLSRSRSRSLSVSLAEERQRERERSVGVSKKRALNREVSMSRGFKPKPKGVPLPDTKAADKGRKQEVAKREKEGVTLVEATPVKLDRMTKAPARSQSQLLFGGEGQSLSRSSSRLFNVGRGENDNDSDDDDEWYAHLSSTPDILTLGRPRDGGDIFSDAEDSVAVGICDTPTRLR